MAHILEHSVLCGSKEFPLKDPFVELVKGSLNTFLNAMTYPDKTCYPVASCNDQDFQNLMHVYLDAVFYPDIYKREEIFRQEGWNYHLEQPEGPLKYNGVVYNEMKGAFSSPDDVLERDIMNSLFPDITYGCESGGDPENIPDLSYGDHIIAVILHLLCNKVKLAADSIFFCCKCLLHMSNMAFQTYHFLIGTDLICEDYNLCRNTSFVHLGISKKFFDLFL